MGEIEMAEARLAAAQQRDVEQRQVRKATEELRRMLTAGTGPNWDRPISAVSMELGSEALWDPTGSFEVELGGAVGKAYRVEVSLTNPVRAPGADDL